MSIILNGIILNEWEEGGGVVRVALDGICLGTEVTDTGDDRES